MRGMNLDQRFPGLDDLRAHARRRLPRFVWEYLDSATGREASQARNRRCLDRIGLMPAILNGPQDVDLSTELFGSTLPLRNLPLVLVGQKGGGPEV